MFKNIIALSALAAGLLTQTAFAAGNCVDSAQAAGKVESGVEAIRNASGLDNIRLDTQFVQVNADGKPGAFQVYARNGELRVDTSKGDKPTTICSTKTGLQAYVELSGLEAAFMGTNLIVIDLKGNPNGLLEITDNLPKKANEPKKTYFKPVF